MHQWIYTTIYCTSLFKYKCFKIGNIPSYCAFTTKHMYPLVLPKMAPFCMKNKKPLNTVWSDCKANSKTYTQRLTKMLTDRQTDGRPRQTDIINPYKPELLCTGQFLKLFWGRTPDPSSITTVWHTCTIILCIHIILFIHDINHQMKFNHAAAHFTSNTRKSAKIQQQINMENPVLPPFWINIPTPPPPPHLVSNFLASENRYYGLGKP